MVSLSPSQQRQRWVFTLNNFDRNFNYKNYLRDANFKIKRAVWGYEKAPQNGTPHLQGYAEFERSVRLGFVRRILAAAHWEGAIGSSQENYLYCTKTKSFDLIGDFSKEAAAASTKKLRTSEVIKGLLNPTTTLQTMLSREYASHHIYFDKIMRRIKEANAYRELYEEWSNKKLRIWQYTVLKRVLSQEERKVTWIYDMSGNRGKSFLANYMCLLYKFQLIDGQINCRDLAGVLDIDSQGICIDVCRAAENTLDYNCLECLKNGIITSGKYAGICLRFKPKKVVVFSNFYPDCRKLSGDRWDILTTGEGVLQNVDDDNVIDPSLLYPFVAPPPACDLTPDFNIRKYLTDKGVIEAEASESQASNDAPQHADDSLLLNSPVVRASASRDDLAPLSERVPGASPAILPASQAAASPPHNPVTDDSEAIQSAALGDASPPHDPVIDASPAIQSAAMDDASPPRDRGLQTSPGILTLLRNVSPMHNRSVARVAPMTIEVEVHPIPRQAQQPLGAQQEDAQQGAQQQQAAQPGAQQQEAHQQQGAQDGAHQQPLQQAQRWFEVFHRLQVLREQRQQRQQQGPPDVINIGDDSSGDESDDVIPSNQPEPTSTDRPLEADEEDSTWERDY